MNDIRQMIHAAHSDNDRYIIVRHLCGKSQQIRMQYDIRSYLIDQFHQKKAVKKTELFHISDPLAKKIYDTILFTRSRMSNFDAFPASARSNYEDIMMAELSPTTSNDRAIELTDIYYRRLQHDEYDLYLELNKNRYRLSSLTQSMTEDDLKIILKFANEHVAFLKQWKRDSESYASVIGSDSAAKELKRIEKRYQWFFGFMASLGI